MEFNTFEYSNWSNLFAFKSNIIIFKIFIFWWNRSHTALIRHINTIRDTQYFVPLLSTSQNKTNILVNGGKSFGVACRNVINYGAVICRLKYSIKFIRPKPELMSVGHSSWIYCLPSPTKFFVLWPCCCFWIVIEL